MAIKFYWDTCVCIDWIQNADAVKRAQLQPIITAACNGEVIIVASALVLAEVVRANGDQPMSEIEETAIRTFFLHPYIEVRPIDQRIAHIARNIMRTRLADRATSPAGNKKIPLNDSIHIACALECGCACLQSFDEDDMLVENQKHSLPGHLKLKIELPSHTPPAPPPAVPKKPAYRENDLFSSLGGGLDEPYIESLKASGDGAASGIPTPSEVQASADPAPKID